MTYENAESRMRDMEILLQWEGSLENARLREVFGIQAVQASRLLNAFWDARREVIDRASPKSPLRPKANFEKAVRRSTPDDYLRLLGAAATQDESWKDVVVDARVNLGSESPTTFALLLQACRAGTGLAVTYRSMGSPHGVKRDIYPHAMIRAPRRWHVRAWCDLRKDFRDFALGRIAQIQVLNKPAPVSKVHDEQWGKVVSLHIVAHPDLGIEQRKLMQQEYFSGKSDMRLKVRSALVGYVVQDLRLALDSVRDAPPDFQLWLKNAAKVGGGFSGGPG